VRHGYIQDSFETLPLVMLPGVKDSCGARCCCRLRPFRRGQFL